MELRSALAEAGVSLEVWPPGTNAEIDTLLDVTIDDAHARFAVDARVRAPFPNEVKGLESTRTTLARVATPMLVAPFVTEGLGSVLVAAGWSWADLQGNFDLRAPGLRLRQRRTSTRQSKDRPGFPHGPGSYAIVRALIGFRPDEDEAHGASALAAQAQVSQPRASQVLAVLNSLDLVEKTSWGRWLPDRRLLLERFIAEYRGPGGSVQYCYTLDSPLDAVITIVRSVSSMNGRNDVAVSGDVGADLVAPWRRPTDLIVYAREALELQPLDLVDSESPDVANVRICVPNDRSIWSTPSLIAMAKGVEIPLADPSQLSWDLIKLGGDDRAEAAEELTKWLLESP